MFDTPIGPMRFALDSQRNEKQERRKASKKPAVAKAISNPLVDDFLERLHFMKINIP